MKNLILYSSPGMIKDAFMVTDKVNPEKLIIGIRTTRFAEEGSLPTTKVVRISEEEFFELIKFHQANARDVFTQTESELNGDKKWLLK